MTTTDTSALEEGLSTIWGSHDPYESTVELLKQPLPGDELMLIDGELVGASNGAKFDNVNPTTEEVLGSVADASADDVDRAVAAARRAFDHTDWSRNGELRRDCLLQLHKALEESADMLRAIAVQEVGVAVRTTYTFHSDFPISMIPYWADLAVNYPYEEKMPDQPWSAGTKRILRHEPVGVVAAITPWNFPLMTLTTKIIPALAAGATVVLKTAPQTPWHATLIARLIAEKTDFPPGVINIVTPSDNAVANELTTDPRVDLIHFTGSTAVGRKLMVNGSDRIARVALELGGKSANILLPDADFEQIVPLAAGMVCMNSGQGCVLPTRMLIPREHYDDAVELATLAYRTVRYGDPTDPNVIQGPQISELQRSRVLSYIEKGREEGARLLAGGGRPAHLERGYFVEPTLFADVDPNSTIAQQEIFGPVLAMMPYDTVDDAVEIANNSAYGLAGSVWSSDENAAIAVARQIRTGMIAVNGGFYYGVDIPSGGYKQSGLGRESGMEGFEEFLETKIMAVGA